MWSREFSATRMGASCLHSARAASIWPVFGNFPGASASWAKFQSELLEELGVEIGAVERLIAVPWRYPEKSVLLDVYNVLSHSDTVHGREGQALRWVAIDELHALSMPPADRPVIAALKLPPHYVITAEPHGEAEFLRTLQRVLHAGEKCIQLRSKEFTPARLRPLARAAHELAQAAGADLLLNGHVELAEELGLGVHLPAVDLMRLRERPLGPDSWVAASCHNERELGHAVGIGVDFAVLGPVQPTPSHAGSPPLGWSRFADLRGRVPFPVYALGGVGGADLVTARKAGAHGVAGISAFWPSGG
jgi:8-oxo-dGTP diphosphatase